MKTKKLEITLHNRSLGTNIILRVEASLVHGTAKWDRPGDVCYHLSPDQVKQARIVLCGEIDQKGLNVWECEDGGLKIFYAEPQGKEAVINILMERNGMTREDAEKECDSFKENLQYMLEQGYPLWQIEEEFTLYFGVEPDYLIDFI